MASANSSTTVTPLTQYHNDNVGPQLDKFLGPEFISYRRAEANLHVAYLEGHEIINLLNSFFKWHGWKTAITSCEIDYKDQNRNTGKWSIGVAVTVRVTVRVQDERNQKTFETSREDVGYGTIENAPSLGKGLEKCRKEATTDALKRAARQLGNATGNCLYNKQYLELIKKVQGPAEKIDFETKKLLRKPINKRKLQQLEDTESQYGEEDCDNAMLEIAESEEVYAT